MTSVLPFSLRRNKQRYLVSCSNQGGGLFLVIIAGRDSRVIQLLNRPTTGLVISPATGKVYAAHFNGVRLFNSELRRLPDEDYVLERAYIHDVKLTSDELLVVVETARDRVAAYVARGEESWSWSPRPETKAGDRHHINSVLLSGDRMLSSMFAPEPLDKALGERLTGAVMETRTGQASGGRILHAGLLHPHSLIERDGALWLCESRRNRVLRYNPSSAEPVVVAEDIPGYTRGLCITDDWVIVGQSRSDAHFIKPLLDSEPNRQDVQCGIWFFPRGKGKRFFVELPAQEVYDIVPLPS